MPHPQAGIIPAPSPNALFLMDYTRAVSGATFFAPSLEVLKSLGSR